ncbi:MAG: pyrroline-5-carboxylate reductase [Eggerthellaceae bacterium]
MNQEKISPIAIIGGGEMGTAIMAGWIGAQTGPAAHLTAKDFIVANPGQERRDYLTEEFGVTCVPDAREIADAKLVVLAVKPQIMAGVLDTIADRPPYSGKDSGPLFISVAAGLSTASLEKHLPQGARLVRVMPNMPLKVGAGAAGVAKGSAATDADFDLVCNLFDSLGYACKVEEDAIDIVCGLSGSGPAYVAAMVDALAKAAKDQGLDENLAENLALQTVYGTAEYMRQTGISARDTCDSICTPGGTTAAAMDAMRARDFDGVFAAGVNAAVRRSKELGA